MLELLASTYVGKSFSRLATDLGRTRRRAALAEMDPDEAIFGLVAEAAANMTADQRKQLAVSMQSTGLFSQRLISSALGMSRDTIRRATQGVSK